MKIKNLEIEEYFILGSKLPTDVGVSDPHTTLPIGAMYVDIVSSVVKVYTGAPLEALDDMSVNVAGINGQLQININGVLSAVNNLLWDDTNQKLDLTASINFIGNTYNKITNDGVDVLNFFNGNFFGANAGNVLTTSSQNIAIMSNALAAVTTGEDNIAIGYDSLLKLTTGNGNVALGNGSLYTTQESSDNIALGTNSLYSNINGNKNISIGKDSMYNNTAGQENIAIGNEALKSNTSGTHNVAINSRTLMSNIDGSNNIAIGNTTLNANTSGSENIGLGNGVLKLNTTGDRNIGFGISSLSGNTSGSDNIAFGDSTLLTNTSGSNNIAIGKDSMHNNTTGNNNVVLGNRALYKNEIGSNNIIIGNDAAYNETTGDTLDNKLFINNGTGSVPMIFGDFSTNEVTINNSLSVPNTVKIGNYTGTTPSSGMMKYDGSEFSGYDGFNWVKFTGTSFTLNDTIISGTSKGMFSGSQGKFSYDSTTESMLTFKYEIKSYSAANDSVFFEEGNINVKVRNNTVTVYDTAGQIATFDNNFKNTDGSSKLNVRCIFDSTDVYLELYGYTFSASDPVSVNYEVEIKNTNI